jgi:predicted RNase H-like HicB family nuclease
MVDLEQEARRYAVVIVPDPDEDYIAQIPGFPTIYTNGHTPEEALANAYDAIALSLAWYYENGKQPPAPIPVSLAA